MTKYVGTVLRFKPQGFGFIQPDGGGKEVFVGQRAVEASGLKTLKEKQRIEYEIDNTNKQGPEAVNLSLVAGNDASLGQASTQSQDGKGTVKWFNTRKGYGFIVPVDGQKDVFVHISAVERAGLSTLHKGQIVTYQLITGGGRNTAENLRVG